MEYTFWRSLDTSLVKVFGVSVGENDQIARQFVKNFGLTFPVLRDPNSNVYSSYSVTGISPFPRDCIIDQGGWVRYLHSEYDPQYMLQTIGELLQTALPQIRETDPLPRRLNLRIYPNPTNSRTRIKFTPTSSQPVRISVYDIRGKLMKDWEIDPSRFGPVISLPLDLRGDPSGIYFIRIGNGNLQDVKKLILVK
ncbi:MAG: hypothetical protein Kow0042_22240 [Calditrichia bacterium]